ncbi:DUF2235 domain-containing protein [Favolaschia claudopus]|uniref:DUF2235 domain-containing protein n=1 Tax=Favolaschia claudopus TaxID=2862362 RepID=A0AAW0EFL6_9AGAR
MSKSAAQALLDKADKKANSSSGWFSSASSKFEEAGDLYQQAANSFKIEKNFKAAGDAFAREAECREQGKENNEAANAWWNAAKAYKQGHPQLAVQALAQTIVHLTQAGRFRQAADREKEIGQIHLQENNDLRKACESYERAGDWYAQEDATATANACYKDAADLHADLEEYTQAIARYDVKEYWLRSGLCSLAMKNDTVSAKRNLAKYSNQDTSYPSTREAKFLQALIEAVEAGDEEAFTGAVVEFDQVTKLDNWKTGMLLKIKRALQTAENDALHCVPPLPLQTPRRRIPQHLALLLVPDLTHGTFATRKCLLETVDRTVGWCRSAGIEKLTVYDGEGILADCADEISQTFTATHNLVGYDSSSASEIEYPPTPPTSDSDSRPLSPEERHHKDTSLIILRTPGSRRRNSRRSFKKRRSERSTLENPLQSLTLCIASRKCSKPAIANVATCLARYRARETQNSELTVERLNTMIEGPYSLSDPEFMIVHHLCPSTAPSFPLELFGFPPWQMRLTEIYLHISHCCPTQSLLKWLEPTLESGPRTLSELDFRAALDEYATAEMRIKKRIIVCCDGWNRQSYTNILRLARTISHEDNRFQPAIPQINFYSQYIVGTRAYAFIAHNYFPGDEIFLFGFSRGAYTARMTAMFIGEIGVLDRADMDHFADIFLAYQKLGKAKDQGGKTITIHESRGKKRADSDRDTFTVKFIGVYDTVGSLGLPEELTRKSKVVQNIFGFNDRRLGEHVQYAYHAMALNETRADFNCCKFEQSPNALAKGQVLRQTWFTVSPSNPNVQANLEPHLSLDYSYLGTLPRPTTLWGEQPPHDPLTGIYSLAHKIQRPLPTMTDSVTHETIHPSVLYQRSLVRPLDDALTENPKLVATLSPLEDALRDHWPQLVSAGHDPSVPSSETKENSGRLTMNVDQARDKHWIGRLVSSISKELDALT